MVAIGSNFSTTFDQSLAYFAVVKFSMEEFKISSKEKTQPSSPPPKAKSKHSKQKKVFTSKSASNERAIDKVPSDSQSTSVIPPSISISSQIDVEETFPNVARVQLEDSQYVPNWKLKTSDCSLERSKTAKATAKAKRKRALEEKIKGKEEKKKVEDVTAAKASLEEENSELKKVNDESDRKIESWSSNFVKLKEVFQGELIRPLKTSKFLKS
ncbi:hypothetical protein NE237_032267 [Protea cynaroides]|uniref:Uncharacterized protein n=1 Tax=Protea cynaroides TaxID=273540 RepID=A0A9Q0R2X8_9MAGN|nr:hypothetical protein NE237_032267 [Protea cynaroides]